MGVKHRQSVNFFNIKIIFLDTLCESYTTYEYEFSNKYVPR